MTCNFTVDCYQQTPFNSQEKISNQQLGPHNYKHVVFEILFLSSLSEKHIYHGLVKCQMKKK